MRDIEEAYAEYMDGEKLVDELHHHVAVHIGVPDSVMWTLRCMCGGSPVCTQSGIAAKLGVSKQTIGSAVRWLARRGLICMEQLPVARNNKRIVLTPEGREFCERNIMPLLEAEDAAFSRLSAREQEVYLSLGIKHNGYLREEIRALLERMRGEQGALS